MNKLLNIIIIISLLFVLGFDDVSMASANEMTPETFIQNEDTLVDSEELIDSLAETVTAFSLVDEYALTAKIQTQVVYEALEVISTELDLVQPLETHLEDINKSANRWLDEIKPQLQQTTQNTISFTNNFITFTDPLKDAIEGNDPEAFLWGINYLEEQLEKYGKQPESLVVELVSYAAELEGIMVNLFSDYEQSKAHLEAEGASLSELGRQLEELDERIKSLNKTIASAIIITEVGVLTDLGVVVTSLSYINDDLETTLDLSNKAYTGTNGLNDSWTAMKTKFVTLRESIDELDWEIVREPLLNIMEASEREAKDINEYARNLQVE